MILGAVLAFDLGERRIGWSASDPMRMFPSRTGFLERSGESYPWRAILELIEEIGATLLVVGDPRHMNGEAGEGSRAARVFGDELGARTGLVVEYQDERLTSVQAQRILRETGDGRRARSNSSRDRPSKSDVDRVAAGLILQTFLETLAHRGRGSNPST